MSITINGQWAKISHRLLDSKLPPRMKLILIMLCRFWGPWGSFPSERTLSSRLMIPRRTLREDIARLMAGGILRRIKVGRRVVYEIALECLPIEAPMAIQGTIEAYAELAEEGVDEPIN